MEKTRAIISANIEKHSHFEEYYKIIDIIRDNEYENPDICIESCKALIEGISKTIIVNLDNTKTSENIDDDNLPKLFKQSMNLLTDNCEDIEGDFILRFSGIIQVLGEIRNKRGDISHGRMAPKAIFSSYKLATSVKNMTESILEYVLEHYFALDLSDGKLDYNSREMEAYNNWLDENTDFPIKKAKYSQLLFENDPEEYENRYSDEFLKEDETEEKEVVIVEDKTESVEEIPKEPVVTVESVKEIEKLVGTFDEKAFWLKETNITQTEEFAQTENLIVDELKKLINNYLFTDKRPLRDDVLVAMNNKPKLSERKTIIEALTEKIIALSKQLSSIQETEEEE